MKKRFVIILFLLIVIPSVFASEVFYLHPDYVGSPIGLTDSSGNAVEEYAYDPYGKRIVTLDAEVENPIGFTGQRFDDSVGLNHFYFRTYDPKLGRFLQRDPSGYADGVNLYEYVSGNSLSDIDPLGLQVPGPFDDAARVIKMNKAVVSKSPVGSNIIKLTFSKELTDKLLPASDLGGGVERFKELIRTLDEARIVVRKDLNFLKNIGGKGVGARPRYGFAAIPGGGKGKSILGLPIFAGQTPRQIRNLERAKAAVMNEELVIIEEIPHFLIRLQKRDISRLGGLYVPSRSFINVQPPRGGFKNTIFLNPSHGFQVKISSLHHELQHWIDDISKDSSGDLIGKRIFNLRPFSEEAMLVSEVRARFAQGLSVDEAIRRASGQLELQPPMWAPGTTSFRKLKDLHEPFRRGSPLVGE